MCFRWLVVLMVVGCSAPIQHGLEESAANDMVTSLERGGIQASKNRDDDGGFSVSVAKGDVLAAMELLRGVGLPRAARSGLREMYKQPSLLPTPTEERARYADALAGEVARTLETVDGIVSARVHLVLPELDPLAVDGKPQVSAQAAVLLKLRTDKAAPISERDVQRLVAGSVPGLDPTAVAVVMTRAPEPAAAAGFVSFGPLRLAPQSRTLALVAVGAGTALLALLSLLVLLLSRRLADAARKA